MKNMTRQHDYERKSRISILKLVFQKYGSNICWTKHDWMSKTPKDLQSWNNIQTAKPHNIVAESPSVVAATKSATSVLQASCCHHTVLTYEPRHPLCTRVYQRSQMSVEAVKYAHLTYPSATQAKPTKTIA